MPPVLIINGSIGAGKTTILGEISDVLTARSLPYCAVDFDALAQTYPRPSDDPFHMRLGAANLAPVWRNAAAVGAERLVVASVVEHHDHLATITGAVDGAEAVVVRLRAPIEVELERIRQRERGSALAWHLERATELWAILEAASVDDAVVETMGRSPGRVAAAVLAAAGWVG